VTPTAVREPLAPTGPIRPIRHVVAGAAALGLRDVLDGPRRAARVIAVFPAAGYLELRSPAEPRVLALVGSDAVRLPNSIVVAATGRELPFASVREGDAAWVGEGLVEITPGAGLPTRPRMRVKVRRWWDPCPVLGPLTVAELARGVRLLTAETTETAERAPAAESTGPAGIAGMAGCGLADHPGPPWLADRCAAGDLAHAVDAAERIVGLGPGLTPSGDDILAGLLVSLRTFGEAVPGGTAAIRLADWLGAAVTAHAGTRTTALSATLLHCAAQGQAAMEVAAVLRGIAGQSELRPAVRRLLGAGHTSGADLIWGLLAGCRAILSLAAETAAGSAAAHDALSDPVHHPACERLDDTPHHKATA
jgi:uncharacterized protein DUF2877